MVCIWSISTLKKHNSVSGRFQFSQCTEALAELQPTALRGVMDLYVAGH